MNTRSAFVLLAVLTGLLGCGDDPADSGEGEPSPTVDAGSGSAEDARAPVADTGTKPVVDSGAAMAGDLATLNALAGRYLLRFDNFGTTTASPGGLGNFTVRSRVSMLVTAELTVDGGKLLAKERFCDQTVLQRCENSSCTASTTVVDPRAISEFLVKRSFAREYTVSGSSFTAGHSVATLGYDEPGAGAMPSSGSDARVWDVVKGDPREGLLTQLTVTLPAPLPAISCKVYGVQKVDTAFAGTLQGTGDAAKFPTTEIVPDLSKSDGVTLGADNSLCSAQDVSSPLEKYNVRMLRVGSAGADTWSCPSTAEFDTKLPGGAL